MATKGSKTNDGNNAPLSRKVYEKELRKLQARLCHLQEGSREGSSRDPRLRRPRRRRQRRHHQGALPSGSARACSGSSLYRLRRTREKTQMYMQRYMEHFPAAGEVVIFDRSWYNRAGVEYVMGFCTKRKHRRFLELCPVTERYIVDGGIILIKFWLEVGDKEQKRRFEARIKDPVRQWKLSPMDLPSRSRWFEYSRARDQMLKATDTDYAPWHVVRSDDKRRRAPELHRAPARSHPAQEAAAREGEASEPIDEGFVRRYRLARGAALRAGELLSLALLVRRHIVDRDQCGRNPRDVDLVADLDLRKIETVPPCPRRASCRTSFSALISIR